MHPIYLATSIFVEKPYERYLGGFQELDDPKQMAGDTIVHMRKLKERFDSEEIPRTYFIIGSHLDYIVREFGKGATILYSSRSSDLVEFANHSWFHKPPVCQPSESNDPSILVDDYAKYREEIRRTNDLLSTTFNRKGPFAFSTAWGSYKGLQQLDGNPDGNNSNRKRTLEILIELNPPYVVCDCRYRQGTNQGDTILLPLIGESGYSRQPYTYEGTSLVELGLHWWQDLFKIKGKLELDPSIPQSDKEIMQSWRNFLEGARDIAVSRPVFLNVNLHPAFAEVYDPNLELTLWRLNLAREYGVELVTGKQLAAKYLECSRTLGLL